MSVDFQLFQFASPPRTASSWIRQACFRAGLKENHRTEIHIPHMRSVGPLLRVTCIRHPVDWLQSYFASIKSGMIGIPEVDAFRVDQDTPFDDFVRRYLDQMPGQVGRMFESYHADVFVRVEDLPWALIDLLESVGVPRVMRERCLVLGRQNASHPKNQPMWSPSLRTRVEVAESEFMERYEYR